MKYMKRGLLLIGLILVLVLGLGFVSSQEDGISPNASLKDRGLEDIQGDVKDLSNNLANKTTYSNLTSGVKSVLNKDPDLPDWAEKGSRIIFGFDKTQNITLSNVVLMLSFTVIMVFLIKGILEFSAFSSGTTWVISLCLVVISLVTGVYTKLVMGLFRFVNGKVGMAILTMFLILFVTWGLFGIFFRFLRPIRDRKEANTAKETAFMAGVNSKLSEHLNRTMADVGKEVSEGEGI